MCVCVYLLQFAGQVLNLSRAGSLEPDAVVSDVEVVHDIVWLRGIENPSHIQQTLQQLPATFVCTIHQVEIRPYARQNTNNSCSILKVQSKVPFPLDPIHMCKQTHHTEHKVYLS